MRGSNRSQAQLNNGLRLSLDKRLKGYGRLTGRINNLGQNRVESSQRFRLGRHGLAARSGFGWLKPVRPRLGWFRSIWSRLGQLDWVRLFLISSWEPMGLVEWVWSDIMGESQVRLEEVQLF